MKKLSAGSCQRKDVKRCGEFGPFGGVLLQIKQQSRTRASEELAWLLLLALETLILVPDRMTGVFGLFHHSIDDATIR